MVSWVMVYVRRRIFANKFRHMLELEIARRVQERTNAPIDVRIMPWWKRATRIFTMPTLSTIPESTTQSRENALVERGRSSRVRPEMIRRMDDVPKLVDPSGFISEGHAPPSGTNTGGVGEQQLTSAAHSISEATELEINRELDSELESDDSVGRVK